MGEEFELAGFELNETSSLLLSILVLFSILTFLRLIYTKTIPEQYLPESTMLILVGLLIGTIIAVIPTDAAATLQDLLSFNTELFLFIFVPVIIFDASYYLNKQVFFRNFLEIFVYAVIGTIINTFIVGGLLLAIYPSVHTYPAIPFAAMFTFAALCSAIDPVSVMAIFEKMHVNVNLYNLAFGESTLNDGVSIVLFYLFRGIGSLFEEGKSAGQIVGLGIAKFFISVFGGILIAVVITFIFCGVSKFTSVRLPNVEPLLFIICGFLSYLIADSLLFSGIMSIMTCGLILSRYAEPNISQSSKTTFKTVIHMLAQTFETMLFLDIGFYIAFISVADSNINFGFIGYLLLFTLLARAFGVVLLTFFLNIRRRKQGVLIKFNEQLILIWGGLRGAIAFALAPGIHSGNTETDKFLLFSTCCLIIFTILVYGLSMKPLLSCLRVQKDTPQTDLHELNSGETKERLSHLVLTRPIVNIVQGQRAIIGNVGHHNFVQFCQYIDRWLQKVFLNEAQPKELQIAETLDHLMQKEIEDHVESQNAILNKQYQRMQQQLQQFYYK